MCVTIFLRKKIIFFLFSCVSGSDIMYATSHVFSMRTTHVWPHSHTNNNGGLTEHVPPGGVKQRAASKAIASTFAGGDPSPKQQKLDFGAKAVSGGELKKLVGRYVVEEMLPLNTVESPSFRAIINKVPTTINAELPHRTSFSSWRRSLQRWRENWRPRCMRSTLCQLPRTFKLLATEAIFLYWGGSFWM